MEPTTQSGNSKLVPVLVVLLIVASFLIGSLYTKSNLLEKGVGSGAVAGVANNGVAPAGAPAAPAAPAEGTPVNVEVAGAPFLGNQNAKIALVEFTDYQCPFCGQLHSNAFPQIKKEYIDTGKIKYYVRDFPLTQIHPFAQKAAEAAKCAKEQNKFWEMHEVLFKNQTALSIDDIKKYSQTVGLNATQFNDCLDSGKMASEVKAQQTAGESVGVRGTPASFVGKINGNTVNGVQISGAVPFETFKATIDKLL